MTKINLFHGTSQRNAEKIMDGGFIPDKSYNWNVKSKKGFVYLSSAYAPFYSMMNNARKLALIKVEVDSEHLYPEDDFIMLVLKKKVYSQNDLDKVDLSKYKKLWKESLQYMGNVAVRPHYTKILGVRYFDGSNLIMKCDPVISPINFKIMGQYYKDLTEWIYEGKDIMKFRRFME